MIDSKCSLLWKHICIRPQFIQQPCCRYISQGQSKGIQHPSDIDLNTESFTKIRKKMLANETLPGCQACYSEEKSGGRSLRQKSNEEFTFPTNLDESAHLSEVEYLEFFVGSVCNLKCMYCSPHLSTSLKNDYHQLGWVYSDFAGVTQAFNDHDPELFQVIDQLDNLIKIKFVGGEPFLNKNHNDWIKTVSPDQLKDLELIYYTNATQIPNEATLDAWSKAQKVQLWLSIDSIGTQNDYLRMSSKWNDIEDNVNYFFELASKQNNLNIFLNMTITPLNVFSIEAVEAWFNALQTKHFGASKTEPYLTYVLNPEEFSLDYAPQSLVDDLDKKDLSTLSKQHQKILNNLRLRKAPKDVSLKKQKEFLEKVSAFDRIRNTSFPLSFPNIYKHYISPQNS